MGVVPRSSTDIQDIQHVSLPSLPSLVWRTAVKRILIQLDTDDRPSTFDRVVAVDADVDELFSYGGISPDNVVPLVHGAIFTRGPRDLMNTAIFIGGSQVDAGEAVLKAVRNAFFGPMRVSVMMDSNGSNTTAAAAVLCARKHVPLEGVTATVLAATGPVGLRAAQLLASEGAAVRVASRSLERSEKTCAVLSMIVANGKFTPAATSEPSAAAAAVEGASVVIAAGAAGVELLAGDQLAAAKSLRVAIDLNAVPPAGIGGIEVMDKAVDRGGVTCYGAIGVGGLKMKIHKAAIRKLFESNSAVIDAAAAYELGSSLA
jgi:hypothetical protein